MNAVVFDLLAARRERGISDEQRLREAILRDLKGKVCGMRLAQAQCRAVRNLQNGVSIGLARHRAVAWALCATDPTEPTPPNAA